MADPKRNKTDAITEFLLAASLVSYGASLAMDAVYIERAEESAWPGLACLMSGLFGVMDGYFCWLANPLLLAAWIMALRRSPAGVQATSIPAFLLQLEFLRHRVVHVDAAGGQAVVAGLGPGYYLWCSSALLMVGWVVRLRLREERSTAREAASDHSTQRLS